MFANKEKVQRISVSLPEGLCRDLDRLLDARGFPNRSQAIADMVRRELVDQKGRQGRQVMAGTITLVYSEEAPSLRVHLIDVARQHLPEVISSLHVMLEDFHTLEVWLVQGPVAQLHCILNKILACRGVKTARLTLTSEVLPPLHARTS